VEGIGQGVSIAFLLAVGILNLRLFRSAGAAEARPPLGLRSGLFLRASRVSHPFAISLIGAAFAISMDTMSQAAVFSMAASGRFAWGFACLLGGVFTLGMLAVDAANGFWVYRMILSLDRRGHAGTRALTLAIALMSLSLAALGLFRMGTSGLAYGDEAVALALGIAAALVPAVSFVLCRRGTPPERLARLPCADFHARSGSENAKQAP
jgi:high-affinity nickel-transport protein